MPASTSSAGGSRASRRATQPPCTAEEPVCPAPTADSGTTCCASSDRPGPIEPLSKTRPGTRLPRFRWVWRDLISRYGLSRGTLLRAVQRVYEGASSPLPTVTARDWRAPGLPDHPRLKHARGLPLPEELGFKPSPQLCEWMMGFPIGWTELPPSETALTRDSPKK